MCIQSMQVLPSTVQASRETRASSPFQPLPSSTFPSRGSFPASEALGQGRGRRAEAGLAPLSTCLPGYTTHLSTKGTLHTHRSRPGSVKLTKGPSCQGLSICSHVNTCPTERLQGELQPWKMQEAQSKKKMGKRKQNSSISLKQACSVFSLESRILAV